MDYGGQRNRSFETTGAAQANGLTNPRFSLIIITKMHGCYNFSLENILTKLNKTILKVRFLTHDTGEKKIFLVIKSSSIPQKKRSFHGPPPIIKGLRAQKVHPRLSRRPNDAPGEAVWPPFVARGGAMAGRWKADHGASGPNRLRLFWDRWCHLVNRAAVGPLGGSYWDRFRP